MSRLKEAYNRLFGSGVKNYLQPGEKVLLEIKRSRLNFSYLLVAYFLLWSSTDSMARIVMSGTPLVAALLGAILVVGPLFFLNDLYLNRARYFITNKRAIHEYKFLGHDYHSATYDQLTDIMMQRGIVNRIFGTGDIIITTISSSISFLGIPQPNEVLQELNTQWIKGKPTVATEAVICEKCKYKNISRAKFCYNCGTPFVPLQHYCVECGALVENEKEYCAKCAASR